MGLSVTYSAPGRCGIIGNPSDIYGGKVLSCSLPARAVCRVSEADADDLPTDLTLWNAAIARFPLGFPVKVEWSSDVPRSSGLAGSTALLAATLACVLDLRGEAPDLSSAEGLASYAELVRDVERHEANVMCGYQDAYMVVHGGLQLMDFAGKHPVKPGPPARMQSLTAPLPFLLITTGVERLSGSVHGPMSERWMGGETLVIDVIAEIQSLTESTTAALIAGDLEALAASMKRNQALITELGGSGEAIDRLIDRCSSHGALATKLAGAGMGGTVISLTTDPDALRENLLADGYTRFIRPEIASGVRREPAV